MKTFILISSRKENNMSNYFKADLFKIYKEHRLFLSLGILLTLSILSAFLLRGNEGYTSSVIQLLSQFITLFFIVPANLYFGEDFSNRTINNIIIKQPNRNQVFIYKALSTIFLNIVYVLIAYISSLLVGTLLSETVDFHLALTILTNQIPLFLCITFLCILLFVTLKRIPQAYLIYSLICLLFDNLSHLISSNLLHLNLPSDVFLFQSLQNAESISVLTFILSTVSLILYCFLSYFIFSRKEFK